MKRLYCLLLPALLLVLTACGRDDDEAAPGATSVAESGSDAPLFAYVPADSAAVFGNLERVPDSVLDAWWAQMEPFMPFYAKMAEDEETPVELRAYFSLLEQLSDREAVEEMGLRSDALAVLYLDGLYPHFRLEFSDRDALVATLDEYSSEADIQWQHGDIEGRQYRWTETENGEDGAPVLALSVTDDHLAVGWIPRSEDRLRHLTGASLPERAVSVSDFSRFNREHDYTNYGSGWFDLVRFSEVLLDPDDGDATAARAALDLEIFAEDPACRAELGTLVSKFPRMIFGMPELHADRMNVHGRIETSADLGEQLAGLVDLPLGLGTDSGGLFNFGIGWNFVNARALARNYVDAWVANPPQCPAFGYIAESAEEWQVQLNRPLPPVFTNIQGFRALVTELEVDGDDYDVRGVASLSMDNPQLLTGMAAMFSPELAALDLQPDGEPRPVPPELFQGMLNADAWIAMSDSAVALAVGEGLETRLDTALAPGETDGTLISYGVDYSAYADMIGQFAESMPEDESEVLDSQEFKSMFGALGDMYDRSFFAVRLSAEGIDFESSANLKQE